MYSAFLSACLSSTSTGVIVGSASSRADGTAPDCTASFHCLPYSSSATCLCCASPRLAVSSLSDVIYVPSASSLTTLFSLAKGVRSVPMLTRPKSDCRFCLRCLRLMYLLAFPAAYLPASILTACAPSVNLARSAAVMGVLVCFCCGCFWLTACRPSHWPNSS